MRYATWTFLIVFANAGLASGQSLQILDDDSDDDGKAKHAAGVDQGYVQLREKLGSFQKSLWSLKERDFIALFGKSQPKPKKSYSVSITQSRMYAMGGVQWIDSESKAHTDFYIIKDIAALHVQYQSNGETPAVVFVYFSTANDFPKLTADNLTVRLTWEENQLKKLMDEKKQRMTEVYPWEVDQKELARLQEGIYATDVKTKLAAWIVSGKSLGYECQHHEGHEYYRWYRPDGTLARAVNSMSKRPCEFIETCENGKNELRKEEFGYESRTLASRWHFPESSINIRYESIGTWNWGNKDRKSVRREWDDNGDGIPDWYLTKEDLVEDVGDDKVKKIRKPLKVEDSWAINPKLIPKESSIPNQDDFRVPIRRKVVEKSNGKQ